MATTDVETLLKGVHPRINLECAVSVGNRDRRSWRTVVYAHLRRD